MPEKIIAAMIAVVAALLLGSTLMASAQTKTHRQNAPLYMQGVSPYRGAVYWRDPYAGTYWEGLAPYGSNDQPDPYAGTYWEGLAPY